MRRSVKMWTCVWTKMSQRRWSGTYYGKTFNFRSSRLFPNYLGSVIHVLNFLSTRFATASTHTHKQLSYYFQSHPTTSFSILLVLFSFGIHFHNGSYGCFCFLSQIVFELFINIIKTSEFFCKITKKRKNWIQCKLLQEILSMSYNNCIIRVLILKCFMWNLHTSWNISIKNRIIEIEMPHNLILY